MKKARILTALCLMLLVLAVPAFSCRAYAEEPTEIRVERILPEKLKAGKENEICLKINAEGNYVVGIVETLPEGWSFPEDTASVCDCPDFKVDKDNRKISFAADNVAEIKYTVIPADKAEGEISGQYVDMLYRNQELDQGKNMWKTIGASENENIVHSNASSDNMKRSNNTVTVIVLVVVVALILLMGKKFIGKEPKNEK